jgi:hypothetical protein
VEDTSEVIRQQMEETKSQLTGKLESLESQVSNTVQTTGSAVNATVEAVQETVETVTGAVQDAVQSVTNAFHMERQFQRNPWLVLGGAAVLGYAAADLLTGGKRRFIQTNDSTPVPLSTSKEQLDGTPAAVPTTTVAAITAAYESGQASSLWNQLRGVAINTLMGVVQNVAAGTVPPIVEYITGKQAATPPLQVMTAHRRRFTRRAHSAAAVQRVHIASNGDGVSSKYRSNKES